MTTRALLQELHCPYCDSGLEPEREGRDLEDIRYGVVRCSCYRYPIIDGILSLRQQSAPADTLDTRVQYLDADDPVGALHCALMSSPIRRGLTRWERAWTALSQGALGKGRSGWDETPASRVLREPTMELRQALAWLRPALYAQYLFQRYANDSFLAAIAPLLLTREMGERSGGHVRVLDLACGIGHSSFVMQQACPGLSLVATDHDFVNLYIAQRYMVPQAAFVCIDAELPLPFADDFFACVSCLDAFHYIRSKVALLKELDRVVDRLGLWLFPHLHNAAAANVSPGIPLSIESYQRCFELRTCCIFDEAVVLRDVMREQSLDLDRKVRDDELQRAPVLSVIGSGRADTWRRYQGITDPLWQTVHGLTVNPIYSVRDQGRQAVAEMSWPSKTLEAECSAVKEYLPARWVMDGRLLERVRAERTTPEDLEPIADLAKAFVLVHLPAGYDARGRAA